MRIVLLAQALRDITQIHQYIAQDNESAANAVVERISKSLRFIESNPHLGRQTPGQTTREWSVPGLPYVIPYRIRSNRIEVIRVYHTRRQRPKSWD